jgi:polygalacturonase
MAAAPVEKAGILNVRAFGASGDGKSPDTEAINKAIAAAAAAGGGTVLFSAGSYLSYSIHLRSNVDLYLDQGCTIVAADSPGYDPPEPNEWSDYQDFGHSHWRNSLLWGEGIENMAILGPGRIWGKGLSKGYGPGPRAEQPGVGNKAISLRNCHNVLLRDFSILHGGHFGILATGVDNLTIDNLRIDTNRDGMDVDCCRNVRISNCCVNSPWDDGICLKSSYGLGWAKPTEFVTITNCYVSGCFEEGTLLDGTYKRFGPNARVPHTGRIKFGTESNGGFRNITVSN